MFSMIARVSAAIRIGLALLLIAAVLLNCANIIGRYFFNVSILASDELQVFAMVAIAFLGAIAISAEKDHLRMDVFVQTASPKVQRILAAFEALLTALFAGLMTWYSVEFVRRIFAMGQRSGMADLPMWLPHGTVTVAFGAITLLALLRLPAIIMGKEETK